MTPIGRQTTRSEPATERDLMKPATDTALPRIIQGGMGVAISSWELARAVSMQGELGVVSGTAIEIVCARRLQDGDPGGHVRRALAHFPIPKVAERIVAAYFMTEGRPPDTPYKNVPMFAARPARVLQEITIAANFVEVYLAKEGHTGPVGINYLRKIELPLPFALYGAILAGVDFVLVGAGNPADVPRLLDGLCRRDEVGLAVRVQGRSSAEGEVEIRFRPRELLPGIDTPLRRPRFLAIVASTDLAAGLAAHPATRPDGFVVEGHSAGGHNAPPRGPRRVDEIGQPVYSERDEVDPGTLAALGLPFWLAGAYGTPHDLARARTVGAVGVQVGTPFALAEESGLEASLKAAMIRQIIDGGVEVRSDWRVSPTGFPFKVADVPGTLSDEAIYDDRERVCDIGALRAPYARPDGAVGYRCPAEPERAYTESKGGRIQNTVGRTCLCNALLATAGFPQRRADGSEEPALVTAGEDIRAARALLAGAGSYTAADVIAYLRGEVERGEGTLEGCAGDGALSPAPSRQLD
jgi:NAD(P)H-dependent flavin oxidoreductase YrpB (nitropropane dioxygenase family)